MECTLIFLLALVLSNVEVPELIHVAFLVGCDHTEPVPHVVLLQVLLGQVLQVPNKNRERLDKAKLKEHNTIGDTDKICIG